MAGVSAVRRGGEAGSFLLDCADGADPREEVFRAVVDNGWVLLELLRERASLEDIFVRLTTGDEAAEVATDSGEGETVADGGEGPGSPEEVKS